jgi:hypothetical protein
MRASFDPACQLCRRAERANDKNNKLARRYGHAAVCDGILIEPSHVSMTVA